MRIVAAAIASCAGAARTTLIPPPEYVYAVDGVMCTVMQCMLDDPTVAYSMCCVRAIHTEFPYPPPKRKPPPDSLTTEDVKKGIRPIRGHIDACREKYPGRGVRALFRGTRGSTVKIRVVVAPSGTVESAFADPPSGDDAIDACLSAAFRRARFRASETGVGFRYPIAR